jgi:hypothetical protein
LPTNKSEIKTQENVSGVLFGKLLETVDDGLAPGILENILRASEIEKCNNLFK